MASTSKVVTLGLIGAGVLFLGSKAANAAQAIAKIKVAKAKISKVKLNVLNIELTMQLDISNPGSIDLPFEYYTGYIIYGGSKLADFQFNGSGKNIVLKGRSITPVVFTVIVSTPALVTKIISVIKDISAGKKVDTIFTISGSVYAAGLDVPVTFTYDIRPGAINGIAGLSEIGKFRLRNLSPVASIIHKIKSKHKRRVALRRKAAAAPAPAPATVLPYKSPSEPIVNTPAVIVPPVVNTTTADSGSGWQGN